MKFLLRKMLPLVMFDDAIVPASSAYAKPIDWYQEIYGKINGIEVSRNNPPQNLLLREATNVYANPGDAIPIGALAPQIVYNVEAYENNVNSDKWFKVETWLGKDTWIHAHRAVQNYQDLTGNGVTTTIVDWRNFGSSRHNTTLFSDAFADTAITWAWLAPQINVEVVAKGNNGYIQIKSWIGLYWIITPPNAPKI